MFEVIKNMMCEDTGRNLLDSGDAYGRHYEENQNGIIDMQFLTLFKEILWMQFLFETVLFLSLVAIVAPPFPYGN